jgi:hypothetical protein
MIYLAFIIQQIHKICNGKRRAIFVILRDIEKYHQEKMKSPKTCSFLERKRFGKFGTRAF